MTRINSKLHVYEEPSTLVISCHLLLHLKDQLWSNNGCFTALLTITNLAKIKHIHINQTKDEEIWLQEKTWAVMFC